MSKGLTLIEVIVSIGIIAFLSVSVYGLFTTILNGITYYREKTVITSLADQYLEAARNMPYSQIGTLEGNPHGNLPDLPNQASVNFNNANYNVYYAISYVDDPSDGTILAGTDSAPNDYKQVKLYVQDVSKNVTYSFFTNIVPKGLEGLINGGALSVKVFDAVGQPVPGATIHIENTNLSPNIDLTRTADASGNWVEVGLPNSANSYHITVTKGNNYSVDQTYPSSQQNQNPVKPDATILNGQVTQVSFSIDLLSNLNFATLDQICAPISGVVLGVRGSKLIGTPDIYKFDNSYSSNSAGMVYLNNIEWDNYTPALASSTYMIYGSSPIQQVNLLPNTSQNFSLILGPKTANSLLVAVKDSSTGNPVEGAQVDLQSAAPPANYTITASAGSNGSITPSGVNSVNSGASQTFNISANSGYSVQNVFVDGASVGAVSSYTFSNVKADHAIFVSFAQSASWLSGWGYRKKITISNSNVDSDLSNFSVLVKISADVNLSSALATGYDIRFADSTGNNLLKYEREGWSGGNGSAVTATFWVKVPAVSHSNSTTIYIYYGNSGATDVSDPANVWDNDFIGVWHMADSASNKNVISSTATGNGLAKANTSTKTIAGKVDKALNFNGTSDNVDIQSNLGNFTLTNNFTISAFVNPSLDSTDDVVYGNTWNGAGYHLRATSANKARFILSRNSSNYNAIDSSVLSSGWHYITGTWNASSPKIFIDGVPNSATPVTQGSLTTITTNNDSAIGSGGDSDSHYFKGPIDEVRVSDIARSDSWIKFEYHNMSDSGNNLTFSGQENFINTYIITALAGANGSITPSGSVSVNNGDSQTFMITPNQGYHILNILVDGVSVGTTSPYTFNNVTSAHTISATFEATVISGGYTITKFTGGSVWNQQDWSDGVGQDVDTGGVPSGLRLSKIGSNYISSGYFISSSFDTGTDKTSYSTLTWQPTSQNPSTAIKFQVATSNDNLTWDFVGPDGTSGTYYTVSGTTINNMNGKRFVKYKVFLSTTDITKTPVLTSVNINYVSGCPTPGQVMYPGLQEGLSYQVTISLAGYQTKIVSNINVKDYSFFQFSLNK